MADPWTTSDREASIRIKDFVIRLTPTLGKYLLNVTIEYDSGMGHYGGNFQSMESAMSNIRYNCKAPVPSILWWLQRCDSEYWEPNTKHEFCIQKFYEHEYRLLWTNKMGSRCMLPFNTLDEAKKHAEEINDEGQCR